MFITALFYPAIAGNNLNVNHKRNILLYLGKKEEHTLSILRNVGKSPVGIVG